MPSKFKTKNKNASNNKNKSNLSFNEFAGAFFNQLAKTIDPEGLENELNTEDNFIIDPVKRIKQWKIMVSQLPSFPKIPKNNLETFTPSKIATIIKSIDKIEQLTSEGEEVYDQIEKLNKKLLTNFIQWSKNFEINWIGFDFTIETFIDFSFNYEDGLESGLNLCDFFLYSHFIRKTWAEDETYLWAPFSLYYFIHFLYQHEIIKKELFQSAKASIIESQEKYYTFYQRYIDPKDSSDVLADMDFF